MSPEQQLERSVLERKSRDELQAIATAMSVKVASRHTKSDIISNILDGTSSNGSSGSNGSAASNLIKSTGSTSASGSGSSGGSANVGRSATSGVIASSNGSKPDAQTQSTSEARTQSNHTSSGETNAGKAAQSGRGQSGSTQSDRGQTDKGQTEKGSSGRESESAGARNGGGSRDMSKDSNAGTNQSDGANRRSRRRRGRERGPREGQQSNAPEAPYTGELIDVEGYLDLRDEGYGFLRTRAFLPSSDDVYVSISQVRKFGLRKGDLIKGACRPAASNEKYPALLRVDSISGLDPDQALNRPKFEDLTPLFPDEKLRLERASDPSNMTSRIVDLLCPIGKGQRGLIVSPPKAGKTTILKQIAQSIEANNPEVHLIVLLVDERPEEVTDMKRSVKGEVVASTFDRPTEEHTAVAELTIEKARRLVETGRDVVIILDGITRLARAYNLAQPATGRIMSGGVDSGALYPPKKFFGSARNIEEGGSLTILATALVETGSKMDEVIFEEFKGTGNMELRLDRRLAERRLYPAIDVNASSTRHEELLFDRSQLQQVWKLRRVLNALAQEGSNAPGLELLMDKMKSTSSNDDFLADIAKSPTPSGA